MTKEEKAKVCEILGFSKALQITRPDAKQTQKMLEEIDKRLTELISASEIPEKKTIEEHHYYHHYDHDWWKPYWTTTTITANPQDTNLSGSSVTYDTNAAITFTL